MWAKKLIHYSNGNAKKEREKNADGCEHIRTKWEKNHSKTVVLIKTGKKESAQHFKQSKRERFFMWISAIFIDPSSIQISGWEMPMLTIIHIRFVSSLFTWCGCCVCVFVCVLFFPLFLHISLYFIYFLYWEHTRQHFVCSISTNGVNECEKGKTSFLMRCDDINICSVRFLVFFFSLHSVETLFNVPTSIYVIVIIWNRIRGEIRNIKWQQ